MNSSMSFLMMILALGCGVAMAAEYKVGNEAGWTRKVPVDYYQWSSGKTFYVGDTLLFQYNTIMHDVMEVTRENFQQCSKENPIAVYRTGSDKIELKRAGLYFFICSTPNHCQEGQKVSVKVDFAPGQPRSVLEEDLKNEEKDKKSQAPSKSNEEKDKKSQTPSKSNEEKDKKSQAPSKSNEEKDQKSQTPSKSNEEKDQKSQTPSKSNEKKDQKSQTPSKSNEKKDQKSQKPSKSPNAPGPSGGLPPYSNAPTYGPSP